MRTNKRSSSVESDQRRSKRERVSTACARCRQRKAKCNGEKPCSVCAKAGERCHFAAATVRVDSDYLRNLEAIARSVAFEKDIRASKCEESISSSSSNWPLPENFQHGKQADVELSRHDNECSLKAKECNLSLLASICDDADTVSLHPFMGNLRNAADRLMGQETLSSATPNMSTTADANDEKISENAFSSSKHQSKMPPKNVADRMMRVYYARVHDCFPMLHWPSIMVSYDEYWSSDDTSHYSPFWKPLIYLIMALACQDGGPKAIDDDSYQTGMGFYQSALHSMYPTVLASNDFQALQCLLLMPIACWNTIGQATRFAQYLQLHIPSSYQHYGPIERESRKRAWAAVIMFEAVGAATLGLPPSISVTQSEVPWPANVDDENITDTKILPQSPLEIPKLSYTIEMTQLFVIQIETVRSLYAPSIQNDPVKWPQMSEILALDGSLAEWERNLPSYAKARADSSSKLLQRQSNVVRVTHLNLRILIHRPCLSVLCRWATNENTLNDRPSDWQLSLYMSSARTCCETAMQLIETVDRAWRDERIGIWWFLCYFLQCAALVILAGQVVDLIYPTLGGFQDRPVCGTDLDKIEQALDNAEAFFSQSPEDSAYTLHAPDGRITANRCKRIIVRLRRAIQVGRQSPTESFTKCRTDAAQKGSSSATAWVTKNDNCLTEATEQTTDSVQTSNYAVPGESEKNLFDFSSQFLPSDYAQLSTTDNNAEDELDFMNAFLSAIPKVSTFSFAGSSDDLSQSQNSLAPFGSDILSPWF